MESIESYILQLLFIAFFIILNALFVATEFAFVRVRASEIEASKEKDSNKANTARDIVAHLDKYISATQLGITLVNLTLGFIGEDIFRELLYPVFLLLGVNESVSQTLAVILGLLIITFFAITIGELAPKTIAIRYPLNISLWSAIPLKIFFTIFKPFIWLLNIVANKIVKLFGVTPVSNDEMSHSEEEIRLIIAEGRKSGVIDSTEHQLIEKIFDFNDKIAREVMIPRNDMFAVDIEASRDKIIRTVIEEGYSRIPVYKDTIDNIIGIMYSKDIISAAEYKDTIILQDIIRPAHFIPETKHIGEVLKDFQRKRIHIGIVVNEHGGVEGLLTLEDILEEIVGEIDDEYDTVSRNIIREKRGTYLINPSIDIESFNKRFKTDIPLDDANYQTLSGFLQEVTGHVPDIFERIDYHDTVFTVMKKSGNKLLQVKIQKL